MKYGVQIFGLLPAEQNLATSKFVTELFTPGCLCGKGNHKLWESHLVSGSNAGKGQVYAVIFKLSVLLPLLCLKCAREILVSSTTIPQSIFEGFRHFWFSPRIVIIEH